MIPAVDLLDLAAVAALVLLSGGLGLALRLGITRSLWIAAGRSAVQLGLLGLLLQSLFAVESPLWVLGWLTVMVVAATRAALARPAWQVPGAGPLAFAGLALTALATTFAVTSGVLGTDPWWQPRVVVPLCGMLLGNALNGIALTLDSLLETLHARRDAIELHLALGAERSEALREPLRSALRRGMTPIVNAMSVVGVVSLPGMMTGQILAGADPWQAARWQLVILFMIAGATTLGSLLVGLAVAARVMTSEPTLRLDRVIARR